MRNRYILCPNPYLISRSTNKKYMNKKYMNKKKYMKRKYVIINFTFKSYYVKWKL